MMLGNLDDDIQYFLMLVIGGLVFFLVIVPVLISVFVRKKRSRTLVATPAENTVEESRHDESPYSLDPIEESDKPGTGTAEVVDLQAVGLEHTDSREAWILTWISFVLFSLACVLPVVEIKVFRDMNSVHGVWALTIGIVYIHFWIPNPLYFCGFAFAIKRRYKVSLVLGAIAMAWALGVTLVGDGHDVKFLSGSWYWVASMLVLVIASIVGIKRQGKFDEKRP
jgi:hypothetical protein